MPASEVYEGVAGLDSALEIGGVEEIAITAKPGQTLEPLPEGASYYAGVDGIFHAS